MQFSEAEISKFAMEEYFDLCPNGLKQKRFYQYFFEPEFFIDGSNRVDHISIIQNRFFWVVEVKITADVASILQILRYKEAIKSKFDSKFKIIKLSIAAQFFTADTIKLAEHLKIHLVQVAPINKKSAKCFDVLMEPNEFFMETFL